MLTHDQLRVLQAVHDEPAVTILWTVPADGGDQPIDGLLAEAAARLRLELTEHEVAERIARLRDLAAQVGEDRGERAVALFASRHHWAVSRLPEPVHDRVVVDETFATRDLVRALHRSPEYLVLALAEPVTRLYEGRGRILREVTAGGFPFTVNAPGQKGRERRHDPGAARDRHLESLTHDLDHTEAMAEGGVDGKPLVVIAAAERLAKFTARTRFGTRIIGAVAHAVGDGVSSAALSGLVWPDVEAWLVGRRLDALAEVDKAAGAKRLAAGIDEVWPLAREGRGRLLVVEEGFEYPARLGGGGRVLEPVDDPTQPGVLDDAVDEAIEYVLTRKGRAAFVPDGTLADRGRIALTLRY